MRNLFLSLVVVLVAVVVVTGVFLLGCEAYTRYLDAKAGLMPETRKAVVPGGAGLQPQAPGVTAE